MRLTAHRIGIVDGHGGRLLVDLCPPGGQHLLQQPHRVRNRPGGELGTVAEVPQVVDVAEELGLQSGLAIKNPPKKKQKPT
jgi:hypothetical protein